MAIAVYCCCPITHLWFKSLTIACGPVIGGSLDYGFAIKCDSMIEPFNLILIVFIECLSWHWRMDQVCDCDQFWKMPISGRICVVFFFLKFYSDSSSKLWWWFELYLQQESDSKLGSIESAISLEKLENSSSIQASFLTAWIKL